MQGISVITTPQGNPKTLTIDVEQHDNQLDPFVNGLLDLLAQQAETTQRANDRAAAHAALNRAYDDDEPEYTDANLIEQNPNYQPKSDREK